MMEYLGEFLLKYMCGLKFFWLERKLEVGMLCFRNIGLLFDVCWLLVVVIRLQLWVQMVMWLFQLLLLLRLDMLRLCMDIMVFCIFLLILYWLMFIVFWNWQYLWYCLSWWIVGGMIFGFMMWVDVVVLVLVCSCFVLVLVLVLNGVVLRFVILYVFLVLLMFCWQYFV